MLIKHEKSITSKPSASHLMHEKKRHKGYGFPTSPPNVGIADSRNESSQGDHASPQVPPGTDIRHIRESKSFRWYRSYDGPMKLHKKTGDTTISQKIDGWKMIHFLKKDGSFSGTCYSFFFWGGGVKYLNYILSQMLHGMGIFTLPTFTLVHVAIFHLSCR